MERSNRLSLPHLLLITLIIAALAGGLSRPAAPSTAEQFRETLALAGIAPDLACGDLAPEGMHPCALCHLPAMPVLARPDGLPLCDRLAMTGSQPASRALAAQHVRDPAHGTRAPPRRL